MKTKSVFYLCLIIAIVFFALGGMSYGWLLGICLGIGLYIGKILFWTVLIGFGILIFYLLFGKHKKNDSGTTN